MFETLGMISHDVLLLILPFGSGYLCDDKGNPCESSLKVTLMLQSIYALTNPHEATKVDIN